MRVVFFILLIVSSRLSAQPLLQITDTAPANLLANKSVVFFSKDYSNAELEEFQRGFQQIGIDAVAHFPEDKIMAGKDPSRVYAEYFVTRDIKFIVLLEKEKSQYVFKATEFNGKPTFFENNQPAWQVTNQKISELLQVVYRDSWLTQKKQNFLINDVPEMQIELNFITGRRSEFYPVDLKVDNLAVPRTGDETIDKAVEQFFAANYPFKYKIVDVNYDEKESRKLGFHFVLCFVKTRARAAREVLGYDMTRVENAYASVTYPNGSSQIKTISADQPVYKFYFKHIESGNVFLGTKWDADETYFQAFKNHLMGFRQELNLN